MKRKIWGKRLSQDSHSIAFYKHSDNDQRDDLLFPYVKLLLRRASDKAEVFSLYPKSVCFTDSSNKWSWNGVRQPGCTDLMVHSCACMQTFCLQAIVPSPESPLVMSFISGWDQFATNEQKFGIQRISQQTVESACCLSGRRYRAHSVSTTRCCQWFPRAPPHRMGVSLSRCDRGPFPDGSVCLQSLETRTTAKSDSHAYK